jgi:hypothetical protein
MTFRDNITCKRCSAVVRRKRFGQRYCSKRCSNAAAVSRFRLRSDYSKDAQDAPEPQKVSRLSPYREVITAGLQPIDLQGVSGLVPSTYTRLFRRPIVNVSGKPIRRDLLAFIITTETAGRPPIHRRTVKHREAVGQRNSMSSARGAEWR